MNRYGKNARTGWMGKKLLVFLGQTCSALRVAKMIGK